MKYLIFDVNNILYRTFYSKNQGEDVDTSTAFALHKALMSVKKFNDQIKPDKIVMAFDRPSWRKDYTKSDKCISKKIYKANRRKNMSPKDEEMFRKFIDHVKEFELAIKENTSVICLVQEGLEADDLIAGFVERYHTDNELYVISSDNDYVQLLKYDNVILIDPFTGKKKDLEKWDGDADLFLFEKCIRGDAGDNIQSAFPRVRRTKILNAYNDAYAYTNMMNETWINQDNEEMRVGDLFKENQLLIDLTKQPEEFKKLINETIDKEMSKEKSFDYFNFMKFLGKHKLNKITDNIGDFSEMFNK